MHFMFINVEFWLMIHRGETFVFVFCKGSHTFIRISCILSFVIIQSFTIILKTKTCYFTDPELLLVFRLCKCLKLNKVEFYSY